MPISTLASVLVATLPLAAILAASPPPAVDDTIEASAASGFEADSAPENVTQEGDVFRSGESFTEAPLPFGYPPPTAPGTIEVKGYPAVRRAQVAGESDGGRGNGQGFWLLFNHINRKGIPMTAPVEMVHSGDGWPTPADVSSRTHTNGDGDNWTMSFLYRSQELGDTGTDGRVVVVDAEPVTVVTVGVRGRLDERRTLESVQLLLDWIEANGHYEIAGHARTLGYNSPATPRQIQWWEVQIPVQSSESKQEAPDKCCDAHTD